MAFEKIFSQIREPESRRTLADMAGEPPTIQWHFVTRSALMVDELLPAIRDAIGTPAFQGEVMRVLRKKLEAQRADLQEQIKATQAGGADVRFYEGQLERINSQLEIDSLEEYIEHCQSQKTLSDSYVDLANRHSSGVDQSAYVRENHHLMHLAELLYEHFTTASALAERFNGIFDARLIQLYASHGVHLGSSDQQFSKYGLLTYGAGFEFLGNKEMSAISDPRVSKKLGIDVPRSLLSAIQYAMSQGWVHDVSFRVDAIFDQPWVMEEVEFGRVFNFDALDLPNLSKLYDAHAPETNLWIKVEPGSSSMTFEELREDFGEIDEQVVTQVVHLELLREGDSYFISHIDHEYILYTLDTYAARMTDSSVKGHKKHKTFKIDNARIPLGFRHEDRLFLFAVLDAYFENKDLLREYFESVQPEAG